MSWQELFNQNTIRRGEAFFRAGRVSEPFLINTYTYQLTVADPVPHTVILRCQMIRQRSFSAAVISSRTVIPVLIWRLHCSRWKKNTARIRSI